MWEMATNLLITKGQGEALYKLNSFDMALLDARIANYNHSLQSSIIPPHCKIHFDYKPLMPSEGRILPTILSRKHGVLGERICTGLALGINADPDLPGLIYEHSGIHPEQTRLTLKIMLQDAASARNWILNDIQIITCTLQVTQPHGCVLVAAVLLP